MPKKIISISAIKEQNFIEFRLKVYFTELFVSELGFWHPPRPEIETILKSTFTMISEKGGRHYFGEVDAAFRRIRVGILFDPLSEVWTFSTLPFEVPIGMAKSIDTDEIVRWESHDIEVISGRFRPL